MIVLMLPHGPTVNNLFAGNAHNKGRHRSEKYEAWVRDAGWELLSQRPGRLEGRISALYEFGRYPDRRRRDIANLEKAVSDLLAKHGVIEDDCMIDDMRLRWVSDVPHGFVRITLERCDGGGRKEASD